MLSTFASVSARVEDIVPRDAEEGGEEGVFLGRCIGWAFGCFVPSRSSLQQPRAPAFLLFSLAFFWGGSFLIVVGLLLLGLLFVLFRGAPVS